MKSEKPYTVNSGDSSDWDAMAEEVNVLQRLEDGEDPEKIISAAYEEGYLTPDWIEQNGSSLRQYGLNDDKLEYYDNLSRQPKNESLEDKRRRSDEEPETEGYEVA